MSDTNIIDFEAELPHCSAEVICVNCFHRYVAVWPQATPMKELECSECGRIGTIITTGCPAHRSSNEG